MLSNPITIRLFFNNESKNIKVEYASSDPSHMIKTAGEKKERTKPMIKYMTNMLGII